MFFGPVCPPREDTRPSGRRKLLTAWSHRAPWTDSDSGVYRWIITMRLELLGRGSHFLPPSRMNVSTSCLDKRPGWAAGCKAAQNVQATTPKKETSCQLSFASEDEGLAGLCCVRAWRSCTGCCEYLETSSGGLVAVAHQSCSQD